MRLHKILFYFYITYLFPSLEQRINENLTFLNLIKSFFLQFVTSIETMVGFSAFYKIIYGIFEISIIGIILSSISFVFFTRHISKLIIDNNFIKLLICFILIYLITLFIYATTGLYAQSSFNLGNRVTTNGCLIFSLLFLTLSKNKIIYIIFIGCFIFSIFGTSNHWKKSNDNHQLIIENLNTNINLLSLDDESLVVLDNNSYSHLGKFSHIEFLSIPWVLKNIYKSDNILYFVNLSKFLDINKSTIKDIKFNLIYNYNEIYYYNTINNNFYKIELSDLNKLILDKNKEIRHWIQLPFFSFTHSFILKLSPRLYYLFQ